MKTLPILLALLAAVLPLSATAQVLPGAAASIRSNLNDLGATVVKKVEKDEGRDQIFDTIQRARYGLLRVEQLTAAGAPRSQIAGAYEQARADAARSVQLTSRSRSDSVRHFSNNVRERLPLLDDAWANYGRRGPSGYSDRYYDNRYRR